MNDEIKPPRHQDTKPAIPLILTAEMTWVGDMTVNGDHCRGAFIEIPKEQLARDGYIPLFCECVVITAEQFKEITAERDTLLAEKSNPETTWDDTVEINQLRAERDEWKRRHDNAVTMLHDSEEEKTAIKQENAELISQGLSLAADRNACALERDALKEELQHSVGQGLIIKEDKEGL